VNGNAQGGSGGFGGYDGCEVELDEDDDGYYEVDWGDA
jgi:hypothetical protein